MLCREYDPRVCERRLPLADVVAWFKRAADLELWLRAKRPSHWKRLEAWRAGKAGKPAKKNGQVPLAALVQIAEAGRAAHEPATHLPARKGTAKRH